MKRIRFQELDHSNTMWDLIELLEFKWRTWRACKNNKERWKISIERKWGKGKSDSLQIYNGGYKIVSKFIFLG